VAEHYILPHQADWMRTPRIVRSWRSSVAASLDGDEDRLSVRPASWKTLSYEVLPFDHVERAKFEARYVAGLKAGKAAVPLWGRGVAIAENALAGDTSLLLEHDKHRFVAGQYVFIQSSIPAEYEHWDVVLIDSIINNPPLYPAGATLILPSSSTLSHDYPAGTMVWPILFGRFLPEDFEPLNSTRVRFRVSVKYDARQVNAFADDDFGDYALGPVSDGELNGGTGWAGPWIRFAA
jgi:hypothetical protein